MFFRALAVLFLAAGPVMAWGPYKAVSPEERRDAIARARVWRPAEVESKDLLNGPDGAGSYKLGQSVACRYEEKDPLHPLGGHSKKFPCWDAAGTRLKIKYDAENLEVYGEVLGSRLFWALGFYAERVYSVKVLCENCPVDPWISSSTARALRVFEPATIETRLVGTELSENGEDGWNLQELDLIDPDHGGAPKADVDALKLLIAFIHHGDDTPNQQRLLCLSEDKGCAHPVMYVTDLGDVFGGRDYDVSLRHWSKIPVWKNAAECVASFKGENPDFSDPRISEVGRRKLAGLLGALSDKQIGDLFRGARVDVLAEREPVVEERGHKPHRVTVDDWVRAFKKKREQIASARCPS